MVLALQHVFITAIFYGSYCLLPTSCGTDELATCSTGTFKCADSRCLPVAWRCDGDMDCQDGSDELDCGEHSDCAEAEYQCEDKSCIPRTWKCDGDFDCTDGSDEGVGTCGGFVPPSCKQDEFECEPGACIPRRWKCDGDNDCLNGKDESDKCTYESSTVSPCGPTGRMSEGRCTCDPGKLWSDEKRACLEASGCDRHDTCSQACVNLDTDEGFRCECLPGYRLVNRTSCVVKGEKPWLYFSNRESVRRIRTDGSNYEMVLDRIGTIAIDVDHEEGLMFYTNASDNKLYRLSLEGLNATPTPIYDAKGELSADGIAVDWLYQHVYWTDTRMDKISVTTYDGLYTKALIETGLDEPRSIAVHPTKGNMYWSDWGDDPKIERSGLDGNSRQVIVSKKDGLSWPNGITLDFAKGRLYWVDARLKQIASSDLDGSDITIIFRENDVFGHPFSIAVFEDYAYWTDWSTESINRVDKLSGTNLQTIFNGNNLIDLKVSHALNQARDLKPTTDRLCVVAECSQLCLPKALANRLDSSEVTCHCGYGYKITEDNKTCVRTDDLAKESTIVSSLTTKDAKTDTTHSSAALPTSRAAETVTVSQPLPTARISNLSQAEVSSAHEDSSLGSLTSTSLPEGTSPWWLYFSQRTSLERVRPDGTQRETVLDNIRCIGLDIDNEDGYLFYTDFRANSIHRLSLNQPNTQPIPIYEGTEKFTAEGIAVDWLYKHIYWTNAGTDEIRVATYDGQYARTLVSTGLSEPRAIVLYPELGYMYWSDWVEGGAKIERSGMAGDDRRIIVSGKSRLSLPNGLSIDYMNQRLYWVDARSDVIMSSELDGSDVRTVIHSDMTPMPHPYGVAVFDGSIYWTDWRTRALASMNTTSGEIVPALATSTNGLIFDVKIAHPLKQSNEFKDLAVSLCKSSNCQQLCLPSAFSDGNGLQEVGCYCGNGFSLADDNMTCIPVVTPPSTQTPDERAWLYFSSGTRVYRIRMNGSSKELILTGIWCVGMDIDYAEGSLFCTDMTKDAIFRIPLSGAQMKPTLVHQLEGASLADGLAVDWLYKHVYWTDTGLQQIKMCTYDGQYARTLVDTDIGKPRAIVVNPEEGFMYWTDWGLDAKIERCGLDGNNRQVIASAIHGLGYPNGLTIDYAGRRLYWVDAKTDRVMSSGLDGSGKSVLSNDKEEIRHPFSIVSFEAHIFWNDWTHNAIKRLDKDNGGTITTVARPGVQLRGMAVFHAGVQSQVFKDMADSLCALADCDQLCIPKARLYQNETQEVGCFCTNGFSLLDDNKSCVNMSSGIQTTVKGSSLSASPTVSSSTHAETTKLSDPCSSKSCPNHSTCRNSRLFANHVVATCMCYHGFVWDAEKQRCLDADECENRGTCSQICVNTVGSHVCQCEAGYTLQDDGFCNADGGAEWLYMTTERDIRRLHYKSGYEQVIFNKTTTGPSLDYDYQGRRLFVADRNSIYSAILHGDLRPIKELLRVNIEEEIVLGGVAVDWLFQRIYWIDTARRRIRSSGYDGGHLRTLIDTGLADPRRVVVDPEHGFLYWTDCGESSHIGRIGLDGSRRETLRTKSHGLVCAETITIDYVDQRLYWIDGQRHMIESSNMDGSNYLIVTMDPRTVHGSPSLAVFEDTVYWVDGVTNSLFAVHKTTGRWNASRTLKTRHVTDIKLYQAKKQRTENASRFRRLCSESNCEYVCTPVPNVDFRTTASVTCT